MSKEFQSPNLESKTIKELTIQLLEAHSNLQTLQKERKMMLVNISHDLRAPIAAIRSAIDLVLSTDTLSKKDILKTLNLIDKRTAVLEDLVNDMYYLFCVEDLSRPIITQSVDACTFLEEYFYNATVDSRYDAFDMQLDVPTNLSCTIYIEPQKMIRVLDNLMINSAKHAGEKATYIRLSANLSMDKGPDRQLIISVSDDGCGIAPEALPHIFTRTYTVSSARTPGTSSGSGLGLSIAKAIVERHGGSINVESKLEEGTRFTVSLPCFCSQS